VKPRVGMSEHVPEAEPVGDPSASAPGWAQAPLDALAHGERHLAEQSGSALRHALVGFDQAIEGAISAYLRLGPGRDDGSEAAAVAGSRGGFYPKSRYLYLLADQRSFAMSVSEDRLAQVHSERNVVQHEPGWVVPALPLVLDGARAAGDALALLAGVFRPVGPLPYDREEPPQRGDAMTRPTQARRSVTMAAWEVARRIDPDAEGLHSAIIADRLVASGFDFGDRDPARVVYDALKSAKDLFGGPREGFPPSVFAWTEPVDLAPADGLTLTDLSDACYAIALMSDPDRRGLHYAADFYDWLLRWRVPIRGIDKAATVNRALATDTRFERIGRRGVYRVVRR